MTTRKKKPQPAKKGRTAPARSGRPASAKASAAKPGPRPSAAKPSARKSSTARNVEVRRAPSARPQRRRGASASTESVESHISAVEDDALPLDVLGDIEELPGADSSALSGVESLSAE